MSEMAVSADEIIVIGRGRFITSGSVNDLTKNAKAPYWRGPRTTKTVGGRRVNHGVVHESNDEG